MCRAQGITQRITGMDFKQLLQFLNATQCREHDAFASIRSLAEQLRHSYGECALAFFQADDSSHRRLRLSSYVDRHGFLYTGEVAGESTLPCLREYAMEELSPWFRADACTTHRGETPLDDLLGDGFADYRDLLSVPLGRPRGTDEWAVLLFPQPGQVHGVEINTVALLATLALKCVDSVIEGQYLQEANQWIESEIESVADLQNRLLPQDFSKLTALRVAKLFRPYRMVGGDYYDISDLANAFDDRRSGVAGGVFGFMIADASGHGSAAAIEIAMLDAILRTYAPRLYEGPAGVLNYTNRYFFTRMRRHSYITAFVSAYFPEQGVLSYANAGHPPPLLKTANRGGKVTQLENSTGIPLGIMPGTTWENGSAPMQEGDILVLYTDGICEAKSPHGEIFGIDRLQALVAESDDDPETIVSNVKQALRVHQGKTEPSDDQTLLVIQATHATARRAGQ